MCARIESEGFDVGAKRLQKIPPNAAALPLVELKTSQQVGFRQTKNSKCHASLAALRRIRFLASSQFPNWAFRVFTMRSASRNAFSCHTGELSRSSSCDRSAQSASIARNFSWRDIFFSGKTTGMTVTVRPRTPDGKHAADDRLLPPQSSRLEDANPVRSSPSYPAISRFPRYHPVCLSVCRPSCFVAVRMCGARSANSPRQRQTSPDCRSRFSDVRLVR
jgi:hypothetical protein